MSGSWLWLALLGALSLGWILLLLSERDTERAQHDTAVAFDKWDAERRAEARRRLKHFEDDLLVIEDQLARARERDVEP